MITTLIFDLDGLLSDTETLHFQAYREIFADHGIILEEEVYSDLWIRRGRGIKDYCAENSLRESPTYYRSLKEARYIELVRASVQPMKGALEILKRYATSKELALVTSSYRNMAEAVIDTLRIGEYFKAIVFAEDVTRLKPDPEPFLLAAYRLNSKPSECLVLEDSEKGIISAYQAGMKSVAIPSRHTASNDFTLATRVLHSLDEVTEELLAIIG